MRRAPLKTHRKAVRTVLNEAQLGVPQLQVLVVELDEDANALPSKGPDGGERGVRRC